MAILVTISSRIISLWKLCAASTRGSIPTIEAFKGMKSSLCFFTATHSFSIIIFSCCFWSSVAHLSSAFLSRMSRFDETSARHLLSDDWI
jgi:hypothetical protein